MIVDTLNLKLHDSETFEQIAARTNAENFNVILGQISIAPPEPKTDYVDINGMNGALDYTEADGLYFSNRKIKVELQNKKSSTFDFDAFTRKYHGKLVDLFFRDTDLYFYTGRLMITDDDHEHVERRIVCEIDADPFRYPISGASTTEIDVLTPESGLLTAASFASSNVIVKPGTTYTWAANTDLGLPNYYDLTLAGDDNPAIAMKVRVPRGDVIIVDATTENTLKAPNVKVYGSKTGGIDRSKVYSVDYMLDEYAPMFFVPVDAGTTEADVYIEFSPAANDRITLQVVPVSTTRFDAGEKLQVPEIEPFPYTRTVYCVNNNTAKYVSIPANSTWTPALVLQPGENYLANAGALEPTEGLDAKLILTYEKAVF